MTTSPTAPTPPHPSMPGLTWAGTRAGMAEGWPLAPSGFVYGLAFGTLAASTGLTLAQATVMSVVVFSGTAQVAAVSVWASLGGLLPAMAIIAVANIRYLLMSASLRPWLGDLRFRHYAPPLALMVDSSYALGMRAYAAGHRDTGYLFGGSVLSWFGWIAGTALGFVFGRLIGDPRIIGLDFVVIGFCAAAAAAMAKGLKDVWPPLAGAAAVLLVERLGFGTWSVVAAALAAATVAMIRWRPSPSEAS